MFKILVVEDDNDLNRTVCLFLNQRGYEAEGCLNANDAYDKMYETVFDLIVSDILYFFIMLRHMNVKKPVFIANTGFLTNIFKGF